MSCGVGHRRGSDLVLLRLWHSPAAVVPIWFLAWEPLYDMGVALKSQKTKTKNPLKMPWCPRPASNGYNYANWKHNAYELVATEMCNNIFLVWCNSTIKWNIFKRNIIHILQVILIFLSLNSYSLEIL